MPWPVHPTGFFGAQGDQDTYRIERSLRFNSADSAYLNRTFSTGNRKTWTWSGWIKRTTLGTTQRFFTVRSGNDDTTTGEIAFETTNQLIVIGWNTVWRRTSQVFRDVSGWYHFVVAMDTTQATANNRVRVYVNGSEVTSFETTNNPTQNADLAINQNLVHYIGTASYGDYSNFYLTEVNFIDGQALTPSSFGETDAITGRWKAKAYSGTYGTNGFYLKFADNSGTTSTTLGKDSSGNGNNWTPNNFSVTAGSGNDSLVDSPTNYGTDSGVGGEVRGNYCTLNALDNGGLTLANGNLDASRATASWASIRSSVGMSSGRWYWEITPTSGISVGSTANQIMIGISKQSATLGGFYQSAEGWGYYYNDGNKWNNNSGSSYGATFTNNDVIGVAFDADNGTLVFYKNNVSQGTAFSGLTSGPYFPTHGLFGTASSVANFGQRPFAYTAPTGFKALCTTNLPQPTIQKPSSYMDVVTYTGNGSTQTISSLGFSPDLIWFKDRDSPTTWHGLFDTIRGNTKVLSSNVTNAEVTVNDEVTSFNSNGITLGSSSSGYTNNLNQRFVAWAWDEAPIAGMDIVSFTAPSSGNTTISHSLGVTPRMIIAKSRNSSTSWTVYHASATTKDQYLFLNTTNAVQTLTDVWGSAAPTSSVFGFNSNNQGASASVIAYLFAEVEGFSKFGSYTGNGSTDGPFIYLGFRPKLIIVKGLGVNFWLIKDTARSTFNGTDYELYPHLANAEGTFSSPPPMDYLSNGIKIRTTAGETNTSSTTYIYAAFAESPFKYARAR